MRSSRNDSSALIGEQLVTRALPLHAPEGRQADIV
jgi:hypothetical protein